MCFSGQVGTLGRMDESEIEHGVLIGEVSGTYQFPGEASTTTPQGVPVTVVHPNPELCGYVERDCALQRYVETLPMPVGAYRVGLAPQGGFMWRTV